MSNYAAEKLCGAAAEKQQKWKQAFASIKNRLFDALHIDPSENNGRAVCELFQATQSDCTKLDRSTKPPRSETGITIILPENLVGNDSNQLKLLEAVTQPNPTKEENASLVRSMPKNAPYLRAFIVIHKADCLAGGPADTCNYSIFMPSPPQAPPSTDYSPYYRSVSHVDADGLTKAISTDIDNTPSQYFRVKSETSEGSLVNSNLGTVSSCQPAGNSPDWLGCPVKPSNPLHYELTLPLVLRPKKYRCTPSESVWRKNPWTYEIDCTHVVRRSFAWQVPLSFAVLGVGAGLVAAGGGLVPLHGPLRPNPAEESPYAQTGFRDTMFAAIPLIAIGGTMVLGGAAGVLRAKYCPLKVTAIEKSKNREEANVKDQPRPADAPPSGGH